jgi:DNA polymerase-4
MECLLPFALSESMPPEARLKAKLVYAYLDCITVFLGQARIIICVSRTILHLDLDAFFCAVEELHSPELKGKAFAVGGRPGERGVVASCSYAARQYGVRSAMPMSQALKLCPRLIIISHRHGTYGAVSHQVMERLHALTPLVEQISIDEAFLDISGLSESPSEIARMLQARIRDDLGLPCSVGVAGNKLVAKIATEVGKKATRGSDYPRAVTVVPPGEEAAFLVSLPVEMLWGVGPKTASRLAELGIHTIGDLAHWDERDLCARFGENGRELARHARGQDERAVVLEHEIKSISQETTFSRDVRDDRVLETTLRELSAEVGKRLRQEHLTGTTVKLKVRWPDFITITRQHRLSSPTDEDQVISATALDLLKRVRTPGQAVRLVGVGVTGLAEQARQLGLFDSSSEKSRRLQAAVDALQKKYGEKAIRRGKGR